MLTMFLNAGSQRFFFGLARLLFSSCLAHKIFFNAALARELAIKLHFFLTDDDRQSSCSLNFIKIYSQFLPEIVLYFS